MFVYVVLYRDSFESVYDEKYFKEIYKEYVDENEKFWKPLIDVVKVKLNLNGSYFDNLIWIFPADIKQ
jgi:hypothetical protein